MDIATLGIAVDSKQADQASASMDKMTSAAGRTEQATQRMGKSASQAAKEAADETKRFERAMKDASIQGQVVGQAISDGIRIAIQAVEKLDDMIRKVGDLKDLAEMTGASAAGLTQMRLAADVANVSMDRVANIMVMMTRQISAVNDESKGAGKALAALGIPIDKFRAMRPDERVFKLADALSKVSDSGGKTALVLDIVGRGGAEAVKLFNALSDESNHLAGYTEELVNQMDDYADSNTRAGSQMKLTVEMLAIEMAPAFAATKGAIMDTISALFGVGKESTALGQNKGALQFAHAVGLGIANIIDLAVKGTMQLIALGKTIGALAAAGATLLTGGGMAGVSAVFGALKEDLASLRKQYESVDTAGAFEARFSAIVNGEKKITQSVDQELQRRVDAYKRANDTTSKAARDAARAQLKAERDAQREREKDEAFRMKWGRTQVIAEGEAVLKINEEYQKKIEEARKLQADTDSKSLESTQDEINAINEKAAAIEEEVRTRGMLQSAIEAEKLAILERDRAEFDGNDQALAELDKRIAAEKRLIEALKGQEVADANDKASKKAQQYWEKTWDQVGQSLADALMQGGMTAAQYLERTFKTLVLKPVIQAGAVGLLAGGAAGVQAAGGSPLGQVAGAITGNIGALFGVGGIGGSIAAGAGWLTGATTLGGALSAGASLVGTGTLGGVASGLGMMAGALGPVAMGVYGLYKLFGGGKGGGPKAEGSAGYLANQSVGQFGNQLDNSALQAVNSLNDTYKKLSSLLGSTRIVQFGVGFSTDPKGDAPSFLDIHSSAGGSYTNRNVGRSDEELQKALADASAWMLVDALRTSGIDKEVLAYFDQMSDGMTNEQKLAAFEQVAQIAQVRTALQAMSPVVSGLSTITMSATANLIQFAGGIQNLQAGISAYQQNFFSDVEQQSMAYEAMAKQLNAAGSGWQGFTADLLASWSKDFFRQVVEGLDMTTEAGQRQFASLMNVAGAFAQVKNAQEQQSQANVAQSQAQSLADKQRAEAEAEAEREKWEAEQKSINSMRTLARSYVLLENFGSATEATVRQIADLTGGLDGLTGLFSQFADNFMGFAEKRMSVANQLAKAFRDTGESYYAHLGNPNTAALLSRQDFKNIFTQIDLTTDSGRRLAAQMLQLQGAFASVTEAIKEPVYYTVDSALQELNDTYNRQKGEITDLRDRLNDATKAYGDFIDSLKTDDTLSQLTPGEKMTELQRQYEMAKLQAEKNNNSPESVAALTTAARALLQGGRSFYGSGQGYQTLYDQVTSDIEAKGAIAKAGASSADVQLEKLDEQVKGIIEVNQTLKSIDQGIRILQTVKQGYLVVQGTPHKLGLERVPFNNYPALLHKDETVLTAKQADFFRAAPNLVAELTALRTEVSMLRRENRQDAGNTISATFEATQRAAQVQSEATMRSSRQRNYQSRTRPVLA